MSHPAQPLVSVALCTYNGAKFIRPQLDSVLQQTYTNIEVVIVDDASADDTPAIIEQYAAADARIRFYRNAQNLGYNKNFEKAFSLCNGDIIAISDQDDLWEKEKVAVMLRGWPAGCDFVYSLSSDFTNENELRPAQSDVVYHTVDDTRMLVFNSPVHGHACMFRKTLLPHCLPFPADVFYDWWLSMFAASLGTIGCIPLTLTYHRVHASNSSRTLTSIRNAKEKNTQLRHQCAHFIETFCARNIAGPAEQASLLRYATLLRELDHKKFSRAMVWYVWQHRKLVFHYKKPKPFVFFSHLKRALRMGKTGLL
jgi:glycosyltransferase involved in cell wall biosynthesis